MHLISGEVRYEGGPFDWHMRAAWKKFGDGTVGADGKDADATVAADNAHISEQDDRAGKAASEKAAVGAAVGAAEEAAKEAENTLEKPAHKTDSPPKSGPDPDIRSTTAGTTTSKSRTEREKISGVYEKFRKIPEKIKYTLRRICDKICTLKKKKDRIEAFFRNSTHQNAFSRLIKELKRLLHFLKPSAASMDLEFGFSDPAYTGYTLAGISMIYPMIGEHAQIRPDFEHKVLRGNVFIKGKIRILYGLIFAWNMFWDKNVRTTYRHIRKFRL